MIKIKEIIKEFSELSQQIQAFQEYTQNLVKYQQNTGQLLKNYNQRKSKIEELYLTLLKEIQDQINLFKNIEKKDQAQVQEFESKIEQAQNIIHQEFKKQILVNIIVWVNNIEDVPNNFFKYHLFSQVRINQYNYVKNESIIEQIFDQDDFKETKKKIQDQKKYFQPPQDIQQVSDVKKQIIDQNGFKESKKKELDQKKNSQPPQEKKLESEGKKIKKSSFISKIFCFCSNSSKPNNKEQKQTPYEIDNPDSNSQTQLKSNNKDFDHINKKVNHLIEKNQEQLSFILLFGIGTSDFIDKIKELESQKLFINQFVSMENGNTFNYQQNNQELIVSSIAKYQKLIKDKKENYLKQLEQQHHEQRNKQIKERDSFLFQQRLLQSQIEKEKKIQKYFIGLKEQIEIFKQSFQNPLQIQEQMIKLVTIPIQNQYDHLNIKPEINK